MHVKQKEGGQRFMTYNFSDAISKFGGGSREEDLGEAYRRAGHSFNGQLQQNFVVLHNASCGTASGSGKAWTHLVVQAMHKGSEHWSVRVVNLEEKVLEPQKNRLKRTESIDPPGSLLIRC
jgi:hypothetical protein